MRKKDNGHGDGADDNHHNRDRELDEDEHRRRQDEEDGKKKQDEEDGKKKNDDDDDNAPGAERHEVAMLGNPHFVSIWKGPKARINFDRQNIFIKLQRAKTHEKSTEGKKIDSGLAQIKVKSESLVMRARTTRAKLGGSSQWREFVQELHEFARRYDANDIDHITDKKDVHAEEHFQMNGEPHRIWYDSDDKDGEFWMASGVRKKFLQKLDAQIQSIENEIEVLKAKPDSGEDLIHHRRMLKLLSTDRKGYLTSVQMNKTAYADGKITREKFIKKIHDSLDSLAKNLSEFGFKYGNKDLQLLGAHFHLSKIQKAVAELRKYIGPDGRPTANIQRGDGHSNSAYCAEKFGWRAHSTKEIVETYIQNEAGGWDLESRQETADPKKWFSTIGENKKGTDSKEIFYTEKGVAKKRKTVEMHETKLHGKRLIDEQTILENNLKALDRIEADAGGDFSKMELYKRGKSELDDCNLAEKDPRQYLIFNHVRKKLHLYKSFFPQDSYADFMARTKERGI